MNKKSTEIDFPVYGRSPLGGNAKEGTATGFAPIRNTEIMDVPLFYDKRVGDYISKLAIQELDDEEVDEIKQSNFVEREQFLKQAGFR